MDEVYHRVEAQIVQQFEFPVCGCPVEAPLPLLDPVPAKGVPDQVQSGVAQGLEHRRQAGTVPGNLKDILAVDGQVCAFEAAQITDLARGTPLSAAAGAEGAECLEVVHDPPRR